MEIFFRRNVTFDLLGRALFAKHAWQSRGRKSVCILAKEPGPKFQKWARDTFLFVIPHKTMKKWSEWQLHVDIGCFASLSIHCTEFQWTIQWMLKQRASLSVFGTVSFRFSEETTRLPRKMGEIVSSTFSRIQTTRLLSAYEAVSCL